MSSVVVSLLMRKLEKEEEMDTLTYSILHGRTRGCKPSRSVLRSHSHEVLASGGRRPRVKAVL